MSDRIDNTDKQPGKTGKTMTDRRTLLGGAAAVGGLMASNLFANAASAATAAAAPTAMAGEFTVAGIGELMITRSFKGQTEPEFTGILDILRRSDLAYGHAEMNFGTPEEIKWTPRGSAGVASYMIADPSLVHELKWAGVDAISLAHNHSFDWGPEGILSTIKHMKEAGIGVAGTGQNLEMARAPGYFEVDKARVAMVSLASGNNIYEMAGHPKADIPGRPGMNPLKVMTRYTVDKASADQLKAIGKRLGVLSDAAAARPQFNIVPGGGVGAGTGTAAFAFQEGPQFGITSIGDPEDVTYNLRSIDEAKKMADFVIVSHHNSTSEASRGTGPSAFVVDFARKAIDAGADVYFGHGWHTFLGIEIYKGRPIIYGMGNFFYQSGYLDRIPADSYESYGADMDKITSLRPGPEMHPGGGQEDWNWAAVYEMKFRNGAISQIILHPVDMGMDFSSGKGVVYRSVGKGEHPTISGVPHLSKGANAQAILGKLQERCRLRGTTMTIANGVGVINVA